MTQTSFFLNLARPNIRDLKPYSSARDEAPDFATPSHRILLDANENSLGSPLETDYSRYPDPHQRSLKDALAKLKGVKATQIFLGNGSDEAIDLLLRIFVAPGRENILVMPPTYGMYVVQANIHGAVIRQAPLRADFTPDTAAVKAAMDAHSKLLYLCSPNNPTGQCLPADFILEMLSTFPGLVVVDEAYVDFSPHPSWLTRLPEFPNLVVLQTMSKAWGLAGLRLGAAYAHPEIIQLFQNVKHPYNLNQCTIELVTAALSNEAEVTTKVAQIVRERERLSLALQQISSVKTVFPSNANFLLIQVENADEIYHYLAQHQIVVRNRSRETHCENCLRITVGSPNENDKLLSLLAAKYG